MGSIRPAAVVLDLEGTVLPIAFVHDVSFPPARARLAAAPGRDDPNIVAAAGDLAEVSRLFELPG